VRPAACRDFVSSLDDATAARDHAATCPRCRAHMSFRAEAARVLRERPEVPPQLLSRALLESTCERIVDAAEAASPFGELLADRDAVDSPAEQLVGQLPEHLLESVIADRLRSSPRPPSVATWNEVRASVVADLASRSASRRTYRVRWTLWAGAAAIAATAAIGLSISTRTTKHTNIVFADLSSIPDSDYFVVRHGAGPR
jgi:hypothetical protein